MSRLMPSAAEKHLRTEDAELNLIPLIDIMSVMVAFLLVYSAERRGRAELQGCRDPAVDGRSAAEAVRGRDDHQGPAVRAGRAGREHRGDPRPESAADRAAARSACRGRCRRRHAGEQQAALSTREITVLADKSLPYEVVEKVMATCTGAAYGKISLAVLEKELPSMRLVSAS